MPGLNFGMIFVSNEMSHSGDNSLFNFKFKMSWYYIVYL